MKAAETTLCQKLQAPNLNICRLFTSVAHDKRHCNYTPIRRIAKYLPGRTFYLIDHRDVGIMTDARDKAAFNHEKRNAFRTYRGNMGFDATYV
jgi:hypothetical protein